MEIRLHSLPKPIIENTTSDRKKAPKTSKGDSNGISENKWNSKIQTSINNRIKSETKGIKKNNKELKTKFGGKMKLKSEEENSKTVVGRNPNDFNEANENSGPSQKTKDVKNPKTHPYKEIPGLLSIPIHNRSQILENLTLQTQDNNENQGCKETIMTRIFL